MNEELTDAQRRVLDFVRYQIEVRRLPPTRYEIASHFGWSSANAAEDHLKALRRKGYIETVPGISRGIRLA